VRLVKNVIGTLEVDPDSKTIWLNSLGKCLLRLKGDMSIPEEKFSTIDGRASFLHFGRDDGEEFKAESFMPQIISLVIFLISKVESNEIQDAKFFQVVEKYIESILKKDMEVKKMGILTDLLSEFKSPDDDETLKKLCDKIYEEEQKDIVHTQYLPHGPNIFLALECPEDFQRYNFVCLEREERGKFIVSHWTISKRDTASEFTSGIAVAKRIKVWDCCDIPVKKIVEIFLEKYNFLRGK